MYQKERLDLILKIVNEYEYVTVKFLSSVLHYSNATINRDLNLLEQQQLIKRTYGGVSKEENPNALLPFRYHLNRAEKLKMGKIAASFVEDGDVIFIDGTTTTEYMSAFLEDKKDLTVITNNIRLASQLSDRGICVYCLGGKIVEPPSMLCDGETIRQAKLYMVNKMFFSTGNFSSDGEITDDGLYYDLHLTMAKNAEKIYFLANGEKIKNVKTVRKYLFDFSKVTCIISDYEFEEKVKASFPSTQFVQV